VSLAARRAAGFPRFVLPFATTTHGRGGLLALTSVAGIPGFPLVGDSGRLPALDASSTGLSVGASADADDAAVCCVSDAEPSCARSCFAV
jgi:hypothetical protein